MSWSGFCSYWGCHVGGGGGGGHWHVRQPQSRTGRGACLSLAVAELPARLSARCAARRVMPETEQESHPGQFSDSR